MDCSQGHTLVACSLRSQLGPMGQNEFVCDSGLRTLDLRAPSRAGANLHFAPGAARLAWHPAEHSSVIVASPGGALQQLDARGHFTAPEQLLIEPLAEGGAQLLSFAVSSTAQLIACGDSEGSIHICAATEVPVEELQVNQFSQHSELPDFDEELPEQLGGTPAWEEPVGRVPLPPHMDDEPLASAWPAPTLGRRGEARLSGEAFVRQSELPPPNQIAYGSISVQFHPNAIGRKRNELMPVLPRRGGHRRHDEEEEEGGREMPDRFARYRRLKIKLGKFGLHEDFCFTDFNQTNELATLDNTVPNAYCNPLLLVLYLLPWTRAYCLGALSQSQFVLSDELGFLFHMMDRSAGSCCQPRNFQRALVQSREASALKLVDAVDLEGNVHAGDSLPDIVAKFSAFLLEQLGKEAREAQKAEATNALEEPAAAAAAVAAAAAAAVAAAAASAAAAPAEAKAEERGGKQRKLTLDEQVALQFAERLAIKEAAAAATAATAAAAAAATAVAAAAAAASASAAEGATAGLPPTVFEAVFDSAWHETLRNTSHLPPWCGATACYLGRPGRKASGLGCSARSGGAPQALRPQVLRPSGPQALRPSGLNGSMGCRQ